MCKIRDYAGLYLKAREVVRLTGINPVMPGYEMLIKAIVIFKVDGPVGLYETVANESTVVPNQKLLTKTEKKRHPVHQQMLEALCSVGADADYDDDKVMSFIKELAGNC